MKQPVPWPWPSPMSRFRLALNSPGVVARGCNGRTGGNYEWMDQEDPGFTYISPCAFVILNGRTEDSQRRSLDRGGWILQELD